MEESKMSIKKTTFEDIKNALWAGANTFRDNIDASNYKDYVLSMLFVKYLSDTFEESVENLKKEYYEKLSKMTKEERLQYFRDNYCNEQKLNFEKEINGTIYKVNTHFDVNAEESILNKFFRLTKKS